jgi:outer membrane receptor for ferric coprogen and ferric-rhodotorulic acid
MPLWTQTKTAYTEAFAKLHHDFNSDWKFNFNATSLKEDSPIDIDSSFYGPIDTATRLIASGFDASLQPRVIKQRLANATVTGSFDWLGHKQHIMVGGDYEHDASVFGYSFLDYTTSPIDPFKFEPDLYPPPDLSPEKISSSFSHSKTIQWGLYASFRLEPIDGLSFTAGGRLSTYRYQGAGDKYEDKNKFTPYYGVTYEFSPHYTAYASFADIYHTNAASVTKKFKQLPPADGDTTEMGVKGAWFDNMLNASLAVFKAEKEGVAVRDPSTPPFAAPDCCYLSGSANSKGLEATVTGMLTPNWRLNAGYTHTMHRDVTPSLISEFPKNVFKLWTNYDFPNSSWSLGGGIRAKSSNNVSECIEYSSDYSKCRKYIQLRQGFYAVASIRASYAFNRHLFVALNVNNILDRRYWQTLSSLESGNWYGQPRNYSFSIVQTF